MMKVFLLVVSVLSRASALMVTMSSSSPATTKLQGRRQMMEQAAGVLGAALIAPKPAFADGAVSPATVQRARGIYGGRIAALKSAVDKGDFAAVADEYNAFVLFNSGAYALTKKDAKAASVAATKEIFAAIDSKNKDALKTAYTNFMKVADISTTPVDVATGQGYSNDYDWKVRTPKGAIYQRNGCPLLSPRPSLHSLSPPGRRKEGNLSVKREEGEGENRGKKGGGQAE
eukprot:CAMPEP_0118897082 /NCGR_PEP_ID=MMETSP1166-20130328/4637_1 /TAXON_ID=1104430 /ORGANISM="Chrysoreinhardia sp, Strain CCMP3193" /LENGTH=229 /DNA_ID=CAMNT_0006836149 /DNA_START=47 /DNA_END=734 /DNA_ORIENTATION=+